MESRHNSGWETVRGEWQAGHGPAPENGCRQSRHNAGAALGMGQYHPNAAALQDLVGRGDQNYGADNGYGKNDPVKHRKTAGFEDGFYTRKHG